MWGASSREEILLSGGDGNDVIKAVAKMSVAPIFGDLTQPPTFSAEPAMTRSTFSPMGEEPYPTTLSKNYVDGGKWQRSITARADTEFIAGVATAINVLKGGSGDDVLDAWARGQAQGTGLVKNYILGGEGNDVLRAYGLTNS